MQRAIYHVDAFTQRPLEGNPAAVVTNAAAIAGDVMQRIALNQHLSETVFLLPPDDASNHARLRIFTPTDELPFAGHPTLAAAHILYSELGIVPAEGEPLRLETKAGLIPVAVDASGPTPLYTMSQRPPEFAPATQTAREAAGWLGLQPGDIVHIENVSTGLNWLLGCIVSLEAMRRVRPDHRALGDNNISIFCIGAESADAQVHVRTFVPGMGIAEDPVTGSSNGCIAALIARDGLLPSRDGELRYVAEQGVEMGQPGRIYARVTGIPDALSVEIGGHAVTVLRGELSLPD